LTDQTVKAWVTASPTDGQANEAVVLLFASTLDVPKSRVSIVRGLTSRSKVVRVEGLDLATCLSKLSAKPE
jgi:uncharacterized protein YggU (UPF0235/DUF167 family)